MNRLNYQNEKSFFSFFLNSEREREMDLSCPLIEFQNLGPLDLTLNLQLYFSMSNISPVYISLS